MGEMPQNTQKGFALIMLAFLLGMVALAVILNSFNGNSAKSARNRRTADALAEAKTAIIGYAVNNASVNSVGYLPNPDMGPGLSPTEGSAAGSIGAVDISLIGKLPWSTLGLSPLKDGSGECLLYIVSGRFKNNPITTSALNWDTQGQIDVIDANGNVIATNLAALIISPGSSLDAQTRALADPALVQCGGNYDAQNYLDPYNVGNAVAGAVNYFAGSANNSLAPNTNNKQFVLASNDYYNDKLLFVTTDELFYSISRRSDFPMYLTNLLADTDFKAHLQGIVIAGNKGTDNVDCNVITDSTNKAFCSNWKEMLLLTQLPAPAPITIDNLATASCTRVVIFGGRKTASQVRVSTTDKADPANYLEGSNLTAFATPIANTSVFNGISTFNAGSPSTDVMRCL
jgi:type II secretory pathway pseudopilin PulG